MTRSMATETDTGVHMRKHKSIMERKTKAERRRAGCCHITAYWLADGFRMKLLANFLKHEHNVVPRSFDEALYVITWLYDMDIIFGLDWNFDEPGNLLVNADCELKICDFGLARGFNQAQKQGFMTEYFATRWYRAPELMLSFANYASAINVWSVGCILDELLAGKPILKGEDYVDQLNQILHYLGTPRAQDYIHSLPIRPRVPFVQMFLHVNPLTLDLLTKMLNFDPAKRIACEQVLERPYLAIWHDPMDEAICPAKFDLFFEEEDSIEGMKKAHSRWAGKDKLNMESLLIPARKRERTGVGHRPASPVIDDPSAELERELAGTHIGRQ
ncbi:CMGC/MAPK/ERK protein kinase [Russula earlei]|uniref:CMGC/MAPK/ERK protein kinase n=1 Tax=Russula earlei TaxID=71964 RepID=A0ACC0UBT3_9AGAM|nr:CMGC/MAPK/ERK protein kinase [Russula earlei]